MAQSGMKRLCLVGLLAALICWPPGRAVAGFDSSIDVYVNNQYVFFSDLTGQPYVANDRLMVPIRLIAEILGAKVEFIPRPRSVRITRGETEVLLLIGKGHAVVDGRAIVLDAAPEIEPSSGRTYVPLRFISESLHMIVEWDAATRQVVIRAPAVEDMQAAGVERQLELGLGTMPGQGAETVVYVALREPNGDPVTAGIRAAELALVHGDGTTVRRRMRESDRPGYWVSHLGLYAVAGTTFQLRATLDDGVEARTAERTLTIASGWLVPDSTAYDYWARGGLRPVFLTPLLDKELDRWLPVAMTAGAEPTEVEEGSELLLEAAVQDAWLRPVDGVKVTSSLTDPRGRTRVIDLESIGQGRYRAVTGVGYPGYGSTLRWQVRAEWAGKVLAVTEGEVITR